MTYSWIYGSASNGLATIISYLPVYLYAESFRVSSAILLATSSRRIVLPPITGCIKDIDRLWNLSVPKLFSDFSTEQYVVASLRHGNTFSLCNSSLLTRAGLVGRSRDSIEVNEQSGRPTTLHLTFIYPQPDSSERKQEWTARFAHVLEAALLIAVSSLLFFQGLWIGGAAILCILINLLLFCLLQQLSSFVFANKHAIAKDSKDTVANGAAIDIHVIAENWNASEIDVLIGYSSQLHVLTNILVRVKNWNIVRLTARSVVVVSIIQAALLASLVSRSDKQAWGSLFWLACYLALRISSAILLRRCPSLLFDGQPLVMEKVSPLIFNSRRIALRFLASLPMTKPRVSRWDWLNVFMPPNERRVKWQTDIIAAGLEIEATDLEQGRIEDIDFSICTLVRDVRVAKQNNDFAGKLGKFLKEVRLRRP